MRRDFGPLSDKIIPISLREDVQVQIYGLPHDLTKAEAAKIGRVIMALSISTASPADRPREGSREAIKPPLQEPIDLQGETR